MCKYQLKEIMLINIISSAIGRYIRCPFWPYLFCKLCSIRWVIPFSSHVCVTFSEYRSGKQEWFSLYLSDRVQAASVNGWVSLFTQKKLHSLRGPWRAVGLILFSLYIQPLSEVIFQSRCGRHRFPDDTQLHQSIWLSFTACVDAGVREGHCSEICNALLR